MKRTTKIKTFVITVSKTFQGTHPRKGEKTFFKRKILTGTKIHTIRGNYKYWKNIVDQVNKGEAILSLREWTGRPYASKQQEINKYKKLGIQKYVMNLDGYKINNKKIETLDIIKIANNDGLTACEFLSWFPESFTGAIIHFTDYRY